MTPVTDAQRISSLATGGKPGFQIDSIYADLESLTDADRDKILSLDSSGIASFDPVAHSAFHYLTTDSKSLLVDVANGGFQTDLSLLFENTTLPSEYRDRHIYSESNTPLEPAPTRFGGAEPMPSPDPKWTLLKSHYELYDEVKIQNGAYGINASNVERDTATGYFDEQQVLPVVSNAQFIFSMAGQKHSGTITKGSTVYEGFLGLWTDVVLTLWNPYNVELRVPDMEVEFYRFPLQVEFFRQNASGGWDSASSNQPVHISQMFNQGNSQFGGGSVQDLLPYRARIKTAFVLKPGEFKVFSPSNQIYNHKNMNYTVGLELQEGWEPGGQGGGIFERYIAVDKNYNGLNKWPGDPYASAQILIKVGDVIRVAVSPAKIDRNASFAETNNEEIVAYMKVFQGDAGANTSITNLNSFQDWLSDNRAHVGAVEIDIPDSDLQNALPIYTTDQMSELTISASEFPNHGATDFYRYKKPFLIASLRLKTEQDSDGLDGKPNGSVWLHNGITNQYFTDGLKDDQEAPDNQKRYHQYEITWEPMTSWYSIPSVEINPTNDRGYGGSGVTSGTGVEFAPYHQIPLAPATSIAQFSHAPLNSGGQAPLTTQIAGNSFASPSIPLQLKSSSGSLGTHLDHSYMANTTLFDSYFFSTATAQTQTIYGSSRNLTTVIDDFFVGTQALPNPNFEPVSPVTPIVTESDYDTFAQHLYNKGAFNVNSTSEEAWALFLASGTNEALPILDVLTASTTLTNATASSDSVVSRFVPLIGDEEAATSDGQNRWEGHRRLTAAQITTLAQNVVAEVKARGPFQSIAEFVNRRLIDDTATGNSGALQTAIENSNLNTDFGLDAPKNNSELGSVGGSANTSDGAATQIIQADLLNRLAPSITVRGDTFRIRAYGQNENINGQTTKVWCEAVIQRGHDFVDAANPSTTSISDATMSDINKAFGRRFKIVSFRWLPESEI